MDNRGKSRVNRRQRGITAKNKSQGDPIFGVLVMQIVVCIILIVSLILVKKFNVDTYNNVKTEINRMAQYTFDSATIEDTMSTIKFNYDYLGELLSDTISPDTSGQGGLNPVNIKLTEKLKPPSNATFEPVMISGKLLAPISGTVTSGFGYRYHPITSNTDFHTGIDIAQNMGKNIVSVLGGTVCEVGDSAIYGNYIVIEHAPGFKTTYSHCSEIIAEVGMKLRQGERIAKVGNTGISTGPHLHFEIKINDMFVDPTWVL